MSGAGADEHEIQVTDDYNQFFRCVGVLAYPELEWLDLPYDDFAGVFWAKKYGRSSVFVKTTPTTILSRSLLPEDTKTDMFRIAACICLARATRIPLLY